MIPCVEFLRTLQGQQNSQPLRYYGSNTNLPPDPAGDVVNGNTAHAGNAGSTVSSPRGNGGGVRNVRPRMEQWAGAGNRAAMFMISPSD
jgi:hypothetical protein